MKTSTVLTRLIPTIAAVRGSGAFNVVIANQAPSIAEDLRKAANDDRIVVDPLLTVLGRLASAGEFEPQQQAMAEVARLADSLLGDIAGGTVVHAAVVHSNIRDLLKRIRTNATSLIDVFRANPATLAAIRADAAEATSLVDAEIREGLRDEEHALIAARLYDAAERVADGPHDARQRDLVSIGRYAAEIAA